MADGTPALSATAWRWLGPWLGPWVGLLLGLVGALTVSDARSLGWDESMHAALPAVRLELAAADGAWREAADVLLDCQQYPFVYPLSLALASALGGPEEATLRAASRLGYGLGLAGLFLLVRATVDRLRRSGATLPRSAELAPWLALALGATSPLFLAYSGTLFLEAPFATLAALALWAWQRRDCELPGRGRREWLAGALLALCLFTKFNYGLLLGAGLAVDLLFEGRAALRRGAVRQWSAGVVRLGAPTALLCLWWFVLPYPGGAEVAASHREALLSFLGGNQQLATTDYARRLWDAATFLAPSPRALLAILAAALLASTGLRQPALRTLVLALGASLGPVLAHNFHLDRFLLPSAVPLWALAAVGGARLLPRAPRLRLAALGLLAAGTLAFPTVDALVLARGLGLANQQNSAYVEQLHRERLSLSPGRLLPTAGLRRAEHDALLAALAAAAGPTARVGWIGINSELSPAALHLGLLARGGDPRRLRRDAGAVRADGEPSMVVTFQSVDPQWSDEQVRAFARGFDLLFSTEPLDWKGRRGREFLARYRAALFADGGWTYERLATVPVQRPVGEPTVVELFVLRPAAGR
jgi:hypothetical protein